MVMIVLVGSLIAFLLVQFRWCVENPFGRLNVPRLLCEVQGFPPGFIGCVGFRRCSDMNDRLSQGMASFRKAEHVEGLAGGYDGLQRRSEEHTSDSSH